MAEHRAQRQKLPRIDGHLKAAAPVDHAGVSFKSPDYQRVLGLENPFPAGYRFHRQWETTRRAAAAEAAELLARVLARPVQNWRDVLQCHIDWWSGLFDIRAAAFVLPLDAYGQALSDHAEAILSIVRRQRLPIGEELGAELTVRLRQRQAHWMAAASTNVFRRRPDGSWEIRYDGQGRVGFVHVEGFELIRRLLESPGTFINTTDLKSFDPASVSEGSPVLDATARRNYMNRLHEIGAERQKAKDAGEGAREMELDAEADAIGQMLQASSGLHRSRRLGDDVDRARKAALRNYKTALKNLKHDLPILHQHFSDAIRPGRSFRYEPPGDVRWETRTPARPTHTRS